jgi:hypothetical protein
VVRLCCTMLATEQYHGRFVRLASFLASLHAARASREKCLVGSMGEMEWNVASVFKTVDSDFRNHERVWYE